MCKCPILVPYNKMVKNQYPTKTPWILSEELIGIKY